MNDYVCVRLQGPRIADAERHEEGVNRRLTFPPHLDTCLLEGVAIKNTFRVQDYLITIDQSKVAKLASIEHLSFILLCREEMPDIFQKEAMRYSGADHLWGITTYHQFTTQEGAKFPLVILDISEHVKQTISNTKETTDAHLDIAYRITRTVAHEIKHILQFKKLDSHQNWANRILRILAAMKMAKAIDLYLEILQWALEKEAEAFARKQAVKKEWLECVRVSRIIAVLEQTDKEEKALTVT